MLVESLPDSRFAFSLHDRWPIEFVAPVTQQAPWFEEDVAAVPIPGPTQRDVVIAAVPAAPLARLDPAWLPGLQALPSSANAAGQPDYAAFRWPAADVARFMSQMTPLNATFGADYQLAGTSLERVQGQTVLNLLWRPLQPSGPYDLYVHLLDAAGKQVAQADLLARSPSAGSGDYVLLTQHPLAAPPGRYVALAGVAHRSTAHPEQVVGGAIGTEVRIPVEI
jgi:hypothetical protein